MISDRVLVGYSLSDRSQPRPDDQLELSSHSEELFAIAESSRVDMTDIRDHQPVMSVRRAVPGKSRHYPISCEKCAIYPTGSHILFFHLLMNKLSKFRCCSSLDFYQLCNGMSLCLQDNLWVY